MLHLEAVFIPGRRTCCWELDRGGVGVAMALARRRHSSVEPGAEVVRSGDDACLFADVLAVALQRAVPLDVEFHASRRRTDDFGPYRLQGAKGDGGYGT